MNSAKKKIALYLSLIFLAGGVAGASVAWTASSQSPPQKQTLKKPDSDRVCDSMRHRLRKSLDLTEEQVRRIDPLLDESACEIEEIHKRTLEDVEKVIERTHARIALELTDEQKLKFERYQKERREYVRKCFNGKKDSK